MNENYTQNNTKNMTIGIINKLLVIAIIILVVILIAILFIFSPMTVSGDSMMTTFSDGDHIFVLKVGYDVSRGDIIVFDRPESEKPPIKRVIAIPGDNIRYDQEQKCWYLNGEILVEEYIKNLTYKDNYIVASQESDLEFIAELTTTGINVQEGELFVLGDNRNISKDSHIYGCIQTNWIKGKFIMKY